MRILILDDDPDALALLQASFASLPYDALFCGNGLDAAIAIFEGYKKNNPFEALVLDCALPRMDGFTLARIVRTCERIGLSKRAKIGFFTAFPASVNQSTSLEEVGAEAFWRKPEDTANLPKLISLWLE